MLLLHCYSALADALCIGSAAPGAVLKKVMAARKMWEARMYMVGVSVGVASLVLKSAVRADVQCAGAVDGEGDGSLSTEDHGG